MILSKIFAGLSRVFGSKEEAAQVHALFGEHHDAARLYLEDENDQMAIYEFQDAGDYGAAGQLYLRQLREYIQKNGKSDERLAGNACLSFTKAGEHELVLETLKKHFDHMGGFFNQFGKTILPALSEAGLIDRFAHEHSSLSASEVYSGIAQELNKMGRADLALLILKRFLEKENDSEKRNYVVYLLKELKTPEANDFLSELVSSSDDPLVIGSAVHGLIENQSTNAVQSIVSFIEKRQSAVNFDRDGIWGYAYKAAIEALGKLGTEEAVTYLKEASQRGDSWPRKYFRYEINDALKKVSS